MDRTCQAFASVGRVIRAILKILWTILRFLSTVIAFKGCIVIIVVSLYQLYHIYTSRDLKSAPDASSFLSQNFNKLAVIVGSILLGSVGAFAVVTKRYFLLRLISIALLLEALALAMHHEEGTHEVHHATAVSQIAILAMVATGVMGLGAAPLGAAPLNTIDDSKPA